MSVDIQWKGPGQSPWTGALHYVGTLERTDMLRVEALAVDPGAPTGIALLSHISHGVKLCEVAPGELADALHSFPHLPDLLVCERPLYGAVRTYDDEPLKVRGFLEYTAWVLGIPFHSVEVQSLKLGHACFHAPQRKRHFEGRDHPWDALAYLCADYVISREQEPVSG